VLSPTDLLALVADQIPTDERATLVAALASEKMLAALNDPTAPLRTPEVLDCPFTDETFVVRALPAPTGAVFLLHRHQPRRGEPNKTDCLFGFKRTEGTKVVPILSGVDRGGLHPFALKVYDAFVSLMDKSEEVLGEAK
jgi:hypothetical protein